MVAGRPAPFCSDFLGQEQPQAASQPEGIDPGEGGEIRAESGGQVRKGPRSCWPCIGLQEPDSAMGNTRVYGVAHTHTQWPCPGAS